MIPPYFNGLLYKKMDLKMSPHAEEISKVNSLN